MLQVTQERKSIYRTVLRWEQMTPSFSYKLLLVIHSTPMRNKEVNSTRVGRIIIS